MNQLSTWGLAGLAVLLSACGGGGGTESAQGIRLPMTVATGAPVEGATVTVVDAAGVKETCDQTTASDGTLTCQLTRATKAPFFIQSQKMTSTLYAVLPETSARVNITPISTAMAKKFANDNNLEPEKILAQPDNMKGQSSSSARDAVELVNAIIGVVAQQTAGITVQNALTQSYTAAQTDALDKLIHNINLITDSTGITVAIPTTTGTVNVSVAFNNTASAAQTSVTTATQGVKANLDDGTLIDRVIDRFFSNLSTCKASGIAETVELIAARQYPNGSKYMEGMTVQDWVQRVCDQEIGTLSRTYSKALARFGNKAIYQFGLRDKNKNEFEMVVALVKENSSWKLMSDNLPINHSIKTRHALEYNIDAKTKTPKIRYQRYLDTWVNAETFVADAIPDRVELHAFALKDTAEGWSATNFSKSAPSVTIYRTSNCGESVLFTLFQNRTGCNSFAQDSDISALFDKLEKNDFVTLILKTLDSNGNCLNCDSNGVPESGTVIGKAYGLEQLFGSGVTKAQLLEGVAPASLPAKFMENARVYFAAPSDSDLSTLTGTLSGALNVTSITIPWQRSTRDGRQINGVWAGYNACGENSPWVGFEEPDFLTLKDNAWAFKSPVSGKTLGQARYLSFTLANRVNESEFAFYVNAERRDVCTQ